MNSVADKLHAIVEFGKFTGLLVDKDSAHNYFVDPYYFDSTSAADYNLLEEEAPADTFDNFASVDIDIGLVAVDVLQVSMLFRLALQCARGSA